jgi:hypothetical protein
MIVLNDRCIMTRIDSSCSWSCSLYSYQYQYVHSTKITLDESHVRSCVVVVNLLSSQDSLVMNRGGMESCQTNLQDQCRLSYRFDQALFSFFNDVRDSFTIESIEKSYFHRVGVSICISIVHIKRFWPK